MAWYLSSTSRPKEEPGVAGDTFGLKQFVLFTVYWLDKAPIAGTVVLIVMQFSPQGVIVSFVQLKEKADSGSCAVAEVNKNKENSKLNNFRFIRVSSFVMNFKNTKD